MLNLKVVHPFGALGRAMEWGLQPIVHSLSFPLRVSQWSEPSGCPGLGVTAVHYTDLTGPFRSQTLTVWRTIRLVIPVLEGLGCGEVRDTLFWFSSVVLRDEDLYRKCLLFHESDFQLHLVIENFEKVNNTSLDYYRLPKGLYPKLGELLFFITIYSVVRWPTSFMPANEPDSIVQLLAKYSRPQLFFFF